MQGLVNCRKCQRPSLSTSLQYEAENMVVTLEHVNCKDRRHKRRLKNFVVMPGAYYCNNCYQNVQAITKSYQTNKTMYLVAGTAKADQFIIKYGEIFNYVSISAGLKDDDGHPIFLFGAIRGVFKTGTSRMYEAMNIYQSLGLLPPPPPSQPPPMSGSSRGSSRGSSSNHNKPKSPRRNRSSSENESKQGVHWTKAETAEFIRWMGVNTPGDVKALDKHFENNNLVAHMVSLDYPVRTEKAYARQYVTLLLDHHCNSFV